MIGRMRRAAPPTGGDFDGPRPQESSEPRSGSAPVPRREPSGARTGIAANLPPAVRRAGWKTAFKTIAGWFGDEHVTSHSAALSFYAAFSLAPIVLLLMLLFGLIIDTKALAGQLMSQETALLGDEGGKLIETMLDKASDPQAGVSAVFAFGAAFVGATTAFAQLKDSLDDVLAEKPLEKGSWWDTLKARVMSFGIVATLGFLMLVSLVANAALAAASGYLAAWLGIEAVWIVRLLSAVIAFLGTFVLFLAIYRLLPERKLSRKALIIGAVASTMLFSLGRIGIGIYLGRTDTVSAFGAAGSLAVVLIWVYWSAVAFFTGALVARYLQEGPPVEAEQKDEGIGSGADR
jgi:membrane protein